MSNLQNTIARSYAEAAKALTKVSMENSRYDKTIVGKVIQLLDEPGAYLIEYENLKFAAYSLNEKEYAIGNSVYVTIPMGDYNAKKIIIGAKYNNSNLTAYTYTRPSEEIVAETENLLRDWRISSSNLHTILLTQLNNGVQYSPNTQYAIIAADIDLNGHKPDCGFEISFFFWDGVNTESLKSQIHYFTKSEFIGNMDIKGAYRQEKLIELIPISSHPYLYKIEILWYNEEDEEGNIINVSSPYLSFGNSLVSDPDLAKERLEIYTNLGNGEQTYDDNSEGITIYANYYKNGIKKPVEGKIRWLYYQIGSADIGYGLYWTELCNNLNEQNPITTSQLTMDKTEYAFNFNHKDTSIKDWKTVTLPINNRQFYDIKAVIETDNGKIYSTVLRFNNVQDEIKEEIEVNVGTLLFSGQNIINGYDVNGRLLSQYDKKYTITANKPDGGAFSANADYKWHVSDEIQLTNITQDGATISFYLNPNRFSESVEITCICTEGTDTYTNSINVLLGYASNFGGVPGLALNVYHSADTEETKNNNFEFGANTSTLSNIKVYLTKPDETIETEVTSKATISLVNNKLLSEATWSETRKTEAKDIVTNQNELPIQIINKNGVLITGQQPSYLGIKAWGSMSTGSNGGAIPNVTNPRVELFQTKDLQLNGLSIPNSWLLADWAIKDDEASESTLYVSSDSIDGAISSSYQKLDDEEYVMYVQNPMKPFVTEDPGASSHNKNLYIILKDPTITTGNPLYYAKLTVEKSDEDGNIILKVRSKQGEPLFTGKLTNEGRTWNSPPTNTHPEWAGIANKISPLNSNQNQWFFRVTEDSVQSIDSNIIKYLYSINDDVYHPGYELVAGGYIQGTTALELQFTIFSLEESYLGSYNKENFKATFKNQVANQQLFLYKDVVKSKTNNGCPSYFINRAAIGGIQYYSYWYQKGSQEIFALQKESNNYSIQLIPSMDTINSNNVYSYTLLKVQYEYQYSPENELSRPISLVSYIPLKIKNNEDIIGFSGPTEVIYGFPYEGNVTFNNIPYSIETEENFEPSSVEYVLISPQGNKNNIPARLVKNSNNQVYLQPQFTTAIASQEDTLSIVVYADNKIVYSCPIIFRPITYESELLNKWGGEFKIDADNNYLLAATIGAGFKDDENKFTGFLLGNISKNQNTQNNNGWGLYAFQNGRKTFMLDTEGNAYFAGLIEANSGKIANWNINDYAIYQNNIKYNPSNKENENGQGYYQVYEKDKDNSLDTYLWGMGKYQYAVEEEIVAKEEWIGREDLLISSHNFNDKTVTFFITADGNYYSETGWIQANSGQFNYLRVNNASTRLALDVGVNRMWFGETIGEGDVFLAQAGGGHLYGSWVVESLDCNSTLVTKGLHIEENTISLGDICSQDFSLGRFSGLDPTKETNESKLSFTETMAVWVQVYDYTKPETWINRIRFNNCTHIELKEHNDPYNTAIQSSDVKYLEISWGNDQYNNTKQTLSFALDGLYINGYKVLTEQKN